jgi:hypothetical protein
MWVISEGLKPGEHLIVQGTDKALPGATVKPVLVKIGADPMGISRFFIDRPIFAWVVAIAIMLAGIGAILSCPSSNIPTSPPEIAMTATYPGASAETLESSVTQIIEQQLTGLDNLLYFSSTSSARAGDDHRDLRQGHQPRYGAGAGAEQGAAGHIAPAHRGSAARRDRHQIGLRLPDGGRHV